MGMDLAGGTGQKASRRPLWECLGGGRLPLVLWDCAWGAGGIGLAVVSRTARCVDGAGVTGVLVLSMSAVYLLWLGSSSAASCWRCSASARSRCATGGMVCKEER